jgi:beta-galactosidase GanA
MPAITVNSYGKGWFVYVGTLLRGESLDAFTTWITNLAKVLPNLVTPAGVRAYERQSADFRLVFLLNFSDKRQEVPLSATWQELLTETEVNCVDLPPAGVAVLKKAKV